ncbi:glycosyltransferase [bacterium]|nr:glycosyltransferase [bacterium]
MNAGVPLVSYVLVNWHTEEMLGRALDSIYAQDYGLYEVVLVDNASPEFAPDLLAGYRDLTLITNPVNRGFAAANNQALSRTTGDYIVLLNCDAWLDPAFVRSALRVFYANPRIGTVVPKTLRGDGSGRIDSTGHLLYLDRTPAHRGRGEKDQGQYDNGGFVFGGSAAAIAYRREMLESIAWGGALDQGGQVFDEAFFAYFEDVDLDWRANLAGWRAYYEPDCVAWHESHGSGGRKNYLIQLRAEKNRYLMLARNDTLADQLANLWPLVVYECWHFVRTLFKPWLWPALFFLLAGLPRAWRLRAQDGPRRKVRSAAVARWFVPRHDLTPPKAEPPAPKHGLLETEAEVAAIAQAEVASRVRAADELFPLASVILVNYNGLELTKRCLAALREQTYQSLEIIVVDNGSVVDEADLLAVTHPEIRALRLERNLGFSGGVNWGASLAEGEYIVLINNDSVPDPDCVRNLVYAAQRSAAAAVSGRLIDIEYEEEIAPVQQAIEAELDTDEQYVGSSWPSVEAALAESRRNHGFSLFGHIVTDAYGGIPACFYPSGGLCCFPRKAIAQLLPELLPQQYFAYHEDVALGFMLRLAGGTVAKEPKSIAIHLAGSTARRLGRPHLRYLMERNRCLNILGFYPASVLWALMPFACLLELGTGLSLLFTRPLDWLGWLRSRLWLVTHPAAITRWRRKCRSRAQVPDGRWLNELSGQVHGQGGALNRLALNWCRMLGIPHRELHSGVPKAPKD